MSIRRLSLVFALLSVPTLMAACAETPKPHLQTEDIGVNDPLEPMNRVVFDVNDFLDRLLLKPLAEMYRFFLPDFVRDRVAGILSNMGEPVVFANNILQGEFSSAGVTAARFIVNTTAGVGGTFEVAEEIDLSKQKGDFGQTLSAWGFGSGPYLVLPLFGPSNVRDAIGLGVDTAASPWQYVVAATADSTARDTYTISVISAEALTRREQVLDEYEAMQKGALDFYAEMRSIYTQYRNKQLGVQSPEATFYDFSE